MFRVDAKQAFEEHASGKFATQEAGANLTEAAMKIVANPKTNRVSSVVLVGLVQLLETALLALIGLGIYLTYVQDGNSEIYIATILGGAILGNFVLNLEQNHSVSVYRSVGTQIGRALAGWTIVFLSILLVAFFLKLQDELSRVWLVSWYATGAVTLVLYRLSVRSLVRHWTATGRLKRRTVIVGGGPDAQSLVESIRANAGSDLELFGLFDDRVDERSPDAVGGCPKLGRVDDLAEFARRTQVDLVIVSMPLSAETRVLEMLKKLWVLPVDIRLSAHMSKLKFSSRAYSYVGGVPVFDIADRPISDWNLVFKAVFDKIVALVALIAFSPLMALVAIAIKLESKGPVFFKQKRHGFNNELIEIYKFRSMYTDKADTNAAKLVERDDPRVTKVGRFIRRTSIDELPQFLNVLKGQLSVVGPRPHALAAKADNQLYYEAVDGYFARHRVKPGITGWAQIHGWRGETDTVEKIMQRVHHDLYYIENWSLLLDLYILIMTPISLIRRNENAY